MNLALPITNVAAPVAVAARGVVPSDAGQVFAELVGSDPAIQEATPSETELAALLSALVTTWLPVPAAPRTAAAAAEPRETPDEAGPAAMEASTKQVQSVAASPVATAVPAMAMDFSPPAPARLEPETPVEQVIAVEVKVIPEVTPAPAPPSQPKAPEQPLTETGTAQPKFLGHTIELPGPVPMEFPEAVEVFRMEAAWRPAAPAVASKVALVAEKTPPAAVAGPELIAAPVRPQIEMRVEHEQGAVMVSPQVHPRPNRSSSRAAEVPSPATARPAQEIPARSSIRIAPIPAPAQAVDGKLDAPAAAVLRAPAPARAEAAEAMIETGLVKTPSGGPAEVQLLLRPENLGRVAIRLVEHSGQLQVMVRSDNQPLRTLLADSLPSLIDGLGQRGWEVSRLEQAPETVLSWWADQQRARRGHPEQERNQQRRGDAGDEPAVFSLES